mmetsp:Transcript_31462/g.42961  ORF Transcript_31462/g.42961 Transcript_31462/m.42961 type:complete len:216 (-) Transcript_31462:365-1012(-)
MVGMLPRIRVSSVITPSLLRGTFRSQRTKTRLPFKSASESDPTDFFLGAGWSTCGGHLPGSFLGLGLFEMAFTVAFSISFNLSSAYLRATESCTVAVEVGVGEMVDVVEEVLSCSLGTMVVVVVMVGVVGGVVVEVVVVVVVTELLMRGVLLSFVGAGVAATLVGCAIRMDGIVKNFGSPFATPVVDDDVDVEDGFERKKLNGFVRMEKINAKNE